MTCIVALAQEGQMHVGGDSAGVEDMDLTVRADRKVFRNGPYIMGFTSSFRIGQLLAYSLKPSAPPTDQDDLFGFMVRTFVEEVRQCLTAGGAAKREHDVDTGGTFIVAVDGRLFTIEEDFQVCECVESFYAVGCGRAYALGSLRETQFMQLSPIKRVERALITAAHFSAGVRGPFHILSNEAM